MFTCEQTELDKRDGMKAGVVRYADPKNIPQITEITRTNFYNKWR